MKLLHITNILLNPTTDNMKKNEIIVPDRLFNEVKRIVKNTHASGTTFYRT
jgi:hypothetical protein